MTITGKTIAILQSNYIPWKGYFDIIAGVDEFIIYDEVQFTRRDWRNRNKIISDGEARWLTIPVKSKGRYEAPINEIEVMGTVWAEKHWRTLTHDYAKAPFFKTYCNTLEWAYLESTKLIRLTDINRLFLSCLSKELGITSNFVDSLYLPNNATSPTSRLVEICIGCAAKIYISGPAAKSYIETELFESANIALRYVNYAGYPVYDQASTSFEPGVSIIDTLFRCGPDARRHLKSLDRRERLLEPI